jgi:hypothetical protein
MPHWRSISEIRNSIIRRKTSSPRRIIDPGEINNCLYSALSVVTPYPVAIHAKEDNKGKA